jgi:hypothetical protein
MKILAVFLVCSVLELVLEVLFTAAQCLFKNRFVRAVPKLPAKSVLTDPRATIAFDGVPAIQPRGAGGDETIYKRPNRLSGNDACSETEAFPFEAEAWK